MRYVLLIYADEFAVASCDEESRRAAGLSAFEDDMRECGVLVSSERLQTAQAATTVRCWDGGDVIVASGPVDRAKEQIVGTCTIECKDQDAAIDVATRIPAAWYGTIEIRPVVQV